MTNITGKKTLGFGSYEAQATLKVFMWTMGTALVTLVLNLITVIDIPIEWAVFIGIVNTILVALKKLFEDNSEK